MASPGQDRVERRLAAILAADVAGYSRHMGADEEGNSAQDPSACPHVCGEELPWPPHVKQAF